jgi:hypothetical protein
LIPDLATQTEALEFLRGHGFHAFTREWALGSTIGVAADPCEDGGIQGWAHMVYIAAGEGGWVVHDLAQSATLPIPATSLGHACSLAIHALNNARDRTVKPRELE